MGIVVTHNMTAAFVSRQCGIVSTDRAKTAEKLSSGYRINRSADDAAGLQISEKMRWQIRGLKRASDNCQEAVSFCQVTDGAMNEMHAMAERLKELSVQAANDTNTEIDRAAIQAEVDEICNEMQRITETTEFNNIKVFGKQREKIVLSGDPSAATTNVESKEIYEVYGNNYGLAEVIGADHLSTSNKLDAVMDYDNDTTWTSTGFHASLDGVAMKRSDLSTYLTAYNSGFSLKQEELEANLASDSRLTKVSEDNYVYLDEDAAGGQEIRLQYKSGYLAEGYIKEYTKNANGEKTYLLDKPFKSAWGLPTIQAGIAGEKYGSAWIDFSGLGTDYKLEDLYGEGFNAKASGIINNIKFTNTGTSTTANGTKYTYVQGAVSRLEVDISGCISGADIVNKVMDAIQNGQVSLLRITPPQYAFNTAEPAKLYVYNTRKDRIDGEGSLFEPTWRKEDGSLGISGEKTVTNPMTQQVTVYSDREMWIQAGAKGIDGMWLYKAWINNSSIGVGGLNVMDYESAQSAIETCDRALNILSGERSKIGAMQNRFTYACSIDDNVVENTQAAESRIRDADMSEEMVKMSRHKILTQVGQSILAQANQSTQGVLNLLQ